MGNKFEKEVAEAGYDVVRGKGSCSGCCLCHGDCKCICTIISRNVNNVRFKDPHDYGREKLIAIAEKYK